MASTRVKTLTGASLAGAVAACALVVAPARADVGSSYPYSAADSRKTDLAAIGAADFNADGHADLLLLGGGSMATAPGDGRGGIGQITPRGPERADDAATADFNGDGNPDLVSAAKVSGAIEVTVSLNLGDGRFARTAEALLPAARGYFADLATGDFDGDGDTDVAVRGSESVADLRWNAGSLLPPVETGVPVTEGKSLTAGGPFAAADFNQDAVDDVLVEPRDPFGHDELVTLAGRLDGTFDPIVTSPGSGGSNGFTVADIDGDGKLDVLGNGSNLAASHANLIVRTGVGDGSFEEPALRLSDPGGYLSPAITDVDGDGDLDVTALGVDGAAAVFEQLEPRSFASGVGEDAAATSGTGLVSADFNADGWPDVAFSRDGSVEVQLNALGPEVRDDRPKFAVHLRKTTLANSIGRLGTRSRVTGTCSVECATKLTIRVPAAVKRRAGMRNPVLASKRVRWHAGREGTATLHLRRRATRALRNFPGRSLRVLVIARARALAPTAENSARRGNDQVALKLSSRGR